MDSNVKVLNMLEKGKLSLKEAERLLKAMNYNDDSGPDSAPKAKKSKTSKKTKTVKKVAKKTKKKAKKKVKVPFKKGSTVSTDKFGNLLVNGKSVGEDDSRRPYQRNRDSGR